MGYMLLALLWWTYLLHIKNNDAYQAKIEFMKLTKIADGSVSNPQDFANDPDILDLRDKYRRQEIMILAEAFVLAISLLLGILFINNAYQKQNEAARQSRNFLLSITHELKSPLASIKLILETFTKRKLAEDKIQSFSKNALEETERLEALVNNLLLAARLENTLDIHIEDINMNHLIENIILKYKNIADIESDIAPTIHLQTDKTAMVSIITNLIENAIKYSKGKALINIQQRIKNNEYILVIADQGLGIPDNEKSKIFDKFYRIGNEDTRKSKGTGLGLYIVKQLIEGQKGNIRVIDNQPQGSLFEIRLPYKQQTLEENI